MEEGQEKDCAEETVSEHSGHNFGKNNFRMYYALGPDMELANSIDYDREDPDDFNGRKFEYFTTDFEEESDISSKEHQSSDLSDDKGVKDEELSDDSGTVDDKEWKGSSVPPDVVASANHFKVIRVEPGKIMTKLDGDVKNGVELFSTPDQDITDFRRHQVEAYTNLEDLLDEPWEESDFAPPSKVDVVLQVGGELGERYSNV